MKINTNYPELIFSGTDYLGTAHDKKFIHFVSEAIQKYGVHYGGSRWANNCPGVFKDAEDFLADLYGVESVLLLSSGSSAGQFVRHLISSFDYVYVDPDLHPAVHFPKTKAKTFKDVKQLGEQLQGKNNNVALLFNAINPSTVMQFNWNLLYNLPKANDYLLILDDSHGLGIMGEQGEGILAFKNKLPDNVDLIVLASLGKSFGLPGGLIMGKEQSIGKIRKLSLWGGASPPPLYVPEILMKKQAYFNEKRLLLRKKLTFFLEGLSTTEFLRWIPDFPVFLLNDLSNSLYRKLLDDGVLISAFAYPDINGPKIERIVINAAKADADISILTELINKHKK